MFRCLRYLLETDLDQTAIREAFDGNWRQFGEDLDPPLAAS